MENNRKKILFLPQIEKLGYDGGQSSLQMENSII